LSIYSQSHRDLQDRFDSRKLADTLENFIVRDFINDEDKAFIESCDFFFLSTLTEDMEPTVSFKGGGVKVADATTLLFPSYNGNGMFYSTGNIQATSKVGILFIDFSSPHRIRFHGSAELTTEKSAMELFPESEMIVRVNLSKMWVNCPRYIPRMEKIEDSENLPREGHKTPIAEWKRLDGLRDVLPENDRELLDKEESEQPN
jgi:hypothetical protein